MEAAWDSIIALFPQAGVRTYRNIDPDTGDITYTYMAFAHTPSGQFMVEKATAAEALTTLDAALQTLPDPEGEGYHEALESLVRRAETAAQEAQAKRDYDGAQWANR